MIGTGLGIKSVSSGRGFVPSDLTTLDLWLKADALALTDGTAISSWTDSSGNNRHLTQVTGNRQPIFKTSIVNGKPIARFDGGNDFMAYSGTVSSVPYTAFCVALVTAIATQDPNFLSSYTTGPVDYINHSNSRISMYAGVNLESLTVNNVAFHVRSFIHNSTSSKIFHDGASIATGNAGTQYMTGGYVISARDGFGAAGFVSGDIAEVILYSSILTTANQRKVEAYLSRKYNIPVV